MKGNTRTLVHQALNEFLVELGAVPLPPLSCPTLVSKTETVWTDARNFAVSYLRRELFRKCGWLDFSIDKRAACLQGTLLMEAHCRALNEKWSRGIPLGPLETRVRKVRGYIRSVLGDCPPALENLPLLLGPGATFDNKKGTTVDGKLNKNGGITSTYRLARRVGSISTVIPALDHYQLVPGARFATVPKTALVDRPIEIPPTFNAMVQRAYGKAIRQRLYSHTGINLRTAQERHHAALRSSACDLASVDFEAASDSIALLVVHALLPEAWFDALYDSRCSHLLVDGEWIELEKFSSMGNGFTFELMTLILWAAAKACGSKEPLVFGDDVIIERELYVDFEDLAQELGFNVNREKSFSEGPFRESCGFDIFDGLVVTPFRIRDRDFSNGLDLVWLHNEVLCWSERTGIVEGVKRLCMNLRKLCWLRNPCFGPLERGDRWFGANIDEVAPIRASQRVSMSGWEGYLLKQWVRSYDEVEIPCRDPGLLRRNLTPGYMASLNDPYPAVCVPSGTSCEGGVASQPKIGLRETRRQVPVVRKSYTVVRDWPLICSFVF